MIFEWPLKLFWDSLIQRVDLRKEWRIYLRIVFCIIAKADFGNEIYLSGGEFWHSVERKKWCFVSLWAFKQSNSIISIISWTYWPDEMLVPCSCCMNYLISQSSEFSRSYLLYILYICYMRARLEIVVLEGI